MKPEDWLLAFEGAVAVMAVLGFVLGLVNLWLTWRLNQPHVQVKLEVGFVGSSSGTGPTLFIVTAANSGRVPVVLASVRVELSAKDESVFVARPAYSAPLPVTLEPGHSWQ